MSTMKLTNLYLTIILVVSTPRLVLAEESDLVNAEVAERVRQELQIERFSMGQLVLPAGLPEDFEIMVEYESVPQILHLQRHSLRAPGFRVRIQQADGKIVEVVAPAPTTYRGFIEGQPDSLVAASLLPAGLTATVVERDGRNWYIEPLPEWAVGTTTEVHIVLDCYPKTGPVLVRV
jgi:hypothetical protein